MLIKICGLSTPETIAAAAEAGASHVGLVHFEPSPRHLPLQMAAQLRAEVPAMVKVVLLLVDPDLATVTRAIEEIRPDVVQLHGKETPDFLARIREGTGVDVWKAIGVRSAQSLADSARFAGAADRLLFDAPPPDGALMPGGTGEQFDWRLLKRHDHATPWGLAGGLTPDNVAEAIRATNAPLVDASSGLESAPGVKDVGKIAAFCSAAKG